jgi:hypothetical protein
MSAPNLENQSYSADVRMRLCVNGRVFLIGQLGPDFIILDDPVDHPPAEGEIAVSIDGRERRWPVQLPDGVAAGKPETRIADCPSAANGSTVG